MKAKLNTYQIGYIGIFGLAVTTVKAKNKNDAKNKLPKYARHWEYVTLISKSN